MNTANEFQSAMGDSSSRFRCPLRAASNGKLAWPPLAFPFPFFDPALKNTLEVWNWSQYSRATVLVGLQYAELRAILPRDSATADYRVL